jgi:L-cysteine:1D-myo-inositol 2-amino-2-deoxy-alpha-D-glucopyranoside ligase
MSKSRGNLVFVSKLIAAGTDPMAIRWALMSDHYLSDRMWSDALLNTAEEQLHQLRIAISAPNCSPTDEVISSVIAALSNDLDTPQVIAILMKWCADTLAGGTGGSTADLRFALDGLLGLNL